MQVESNEINVSLDCSEIKAEIEKKVFVVVDGGRGPAGENEFLRLEFTHNNANDELIINQEINNTNYVFTYTIFRNALGPRFVISGDNWLDETTPIMNAWVDKNIIVNNLMDMDDNKIYVTLRTTGLNKYRIGLILLK